jgi:arylsulfatase
LGRRPNIVLIVADDLGFSDVGAFGGEIDTPNLDRLADDGLRLSQMYNAARCCPSRASILTGVYPHQAGVGHMTLDLGHPAYRGRLTPDRRTVAELLRDAGYRTFMVGKWHVGGEYPLQEGPGDWSPGGDAWPVPWERGFESFYGTLTGAGSYYEPVTLMDGTSFVRKDKLPEDFYYTDEIGRRAVAAVREGARSGSPFFLYVAHVAPHWPLHAREEDIARFRERYRVGWDEIRVQRRERAIEAGLLDESWRLSPRDEYAPGWESVEHQAWEAERMAVYAAQVHALDRTVGELIAELDSQGVRDDTIVVFISDNGGCSELLREDERVEPPMRTTRHGQSVRSSNDPAVWPGPPTTFTSYGLPWANASNSPFRLFKHWVHEGGIATPCIVSWPGVVAPEVRHDPAHVIDLAATFCDLAGASSRSAPDGSPLEGTPLTDLLRGGRIVRAAPIFWEHEGNRAVRWERWKLVARTGMPWELYDMVGDRTETEDVALEHPEVVESLASAWARWAARVGVVDWDIVRDWVGEKREPRLYGWVVRGRPEQ